MSSGNIGSVAASAASAYKRAPVYTAFTTGARADASTVVSSATPITAVQQITSVNNAVNTISSKEAAEAMRQVRDYVKEVVPELDFSIDEDTGRLVVKLMDMSTNELIRQMPAEEILHVAKMLDKLQGLLYNDEV